MRSVTRNGMHISAETRLCPTKDGILNPGIHEFREFGEFSAKDGSTVCVGWIGLRSNGHVTHVQWHTTRHGQCPHCENDVPLAPDGRTMYHGDIIRMIGDCLGSREFPVSK